MRALALLPLATAAFGAYTFYYSDSFGSINLSNWSQNGVLTTSAAGLTSADAAGGSLISRVAVPDGSSEYHIRTQLRLASAGGSYIHYLRANDWSMLGPSPDGAFLAAELRGLTGSYNYNATLAISRRVNGVYTELATMAVGVKYDTTMESVLTAAGQVMVYINGVLVYGPGGGGVASGKPGVGVMNAPAGNGILSVDLGPLDRTAPGAVSASTVATSGLPTRVDFQWKGSEDNVNGIGISRYVITRNGTGLAAVRAGLFSDTTVAAGTSYAYTIQPVDRHNNYGTATGVTVVTPAAGTGDSRRVGVKANSPTWGSHGEQIDLFSGNVNFTLPLVTGTRRDGSKVTLGLNYNSQNWRKDAGGLWNLGRDTGYGYGWNLSAGTLRPHYSDFWTVHHYTYTDETGAEYRLDYYSGGTWRSTDGTFARYEDAAARLWFLDGTSRYYFCVSGEGEPDAGTLYPQLFYDRNGNSISIQYKPGIGAGTGNTSGRIESIADPRGSAGAPVFDFQYSADPLPRLTSITNRINTGEAYTFTYAANQALTAPIAPYTQFGTTHLLTSVSVTNLGLSHSFQYGANNAGELVKVTYPYGADTQWNYVDFAFGNGRTLREVNGRWLRPQAGATQWYYAITPSNSGTPQNCHQGRVVLDANGIDDRLWSFQTNPAVFNYGLPVSVQERTNSPSLKVLATREFTFTQFSAGNIYLSETRTRLDPGTAFEKSSRSTNTLDSHGNLLDQKVYAFGIDTTPARTYTHGYISSYGYRLFGLRLWSDVTEGTTTKRLAEYEYDGRSSALCPAGSTNLVDIQPGPVYWHDGGYGLSYLARGNPTWVKSLGKPGSCLSYDIAGNVVKAQDLLGHRVDFTLGAASNWSLPSAVTPNGETNLASSYQWNSFFGLAQNVNPNNSTAAFTYDTMARPATTTSPHGAVTNYSYATATEGSVTTATTNGKWVKTTTDGLGRTIRAEKGYGTTTVSVVETEYGPCACSATGKVKRVSQPYAPGGTKYWTEFEYDARGRTVKVTPPGSAGFTTYLYEGNTVKVTDPAGKWKKHTMDSLGRLLKVTEPRPGGGGATDDTDYEFNLVDKLTRVTMVRGGTTQLRDFAYDSDMRLSSVTQPENGTVSYTYNTDGRVATKTDARNQRVAYSYDAYGRTSMMQRYPVAGGAEDMAQRTTFTYDTGTGANLWGRLAKVTYGVTGAASESYSYRPSGLVAMKQLTVGTGGLANLGVEYYWDNEGRPTSMEYPQLGKLNNGGYQWQPVKALNYGYDSAGRLNRIYYPGTSAVDYANSAQYNPAGQLTALTRAAGITIDAGTWLPTGATSYQTESFQFNVLGQMTRQTGAGADVEYRFSSTANDGRLWQRKDWISGEEVSYAYDELGRLISAATTGPEWGLAWVYDGFGNRLQQNVTKGSGYSVQMTVNAANNRLSGTGFVFDSNGNQTGWPSGGGSATAAYDVENRLVSVTTPNGVESYAYSVRNERLWKQAQGQEKTYFLYGAFGELVGSYRTCTSGTSTFFCEGKERVYFAGRLILSENVGVTADRLGSVVSGMRYYPYGEQVGGATAEEREKFGTYWRDSISGLDYARNRYYGSTWGRFTSADPYVMSGGLGNPQGWNRYAYVENDPVNYGDPSGLEKEPTFSITTYLISVTVTATLRPATRPPDQIQWGFFNAHGVDPDVYYAMREEPTRSEAGIGTNPGKLDSVAEPAPDPPGPQAESRVDCIRRIHREVDQNFEPFESSIREKAYAIAKNMSLVLSIAGLIGGGFAAGPPGALVGTAGGAVFGFITPFLYAHLAEVMIAAGKLAIANQRIDAECPSQ
ncbi:MAG: RHS repeat-associated core domain-containing protein [Candidatus Solibacter usitatus]|nr:RHS repeat-associated core domain-containing protein [Candidatus Solibacter usitatus]